YVIDERLMRQCAIHRPCINVRKAQFLGRHFGNGALPRARWTVNRNLNAIYHIIYPRSQFENIVSYRKGKSPVHADFPLCMDLDRNEKHFKSVSYDSRFLDCNCRSKQKRMIYCLSTASMSSN